MIQFLMLVSTQPQLQDRKLQQQDQDKDHIKWNQGHIQLVSKLIFGQEPVSRLNTNRIKDSQSQIPSSC